MQNVRCKTEPASASLNDSFDNSSFALIKESAVDETADNPFRKKKSKISDASNSVVLKNSILDPEQETTIKDYQSVLKKRSKTVSLQCSLITGLPNLTFGFKNNVYEQKLHEKVKPLVSNAKKEKKETLKK
jgi:hypothetical protein